MLTLNAHSLLEENYLRKLAWFVELVIREHPDLIALQEVNQSVGAAAAEADMLGGLAVLPGSVTVSSDNHAAWVAYLLAQAGLPVSWVWLPVKLGYGRYDEGLALLSLCGRIAEVDEVLLSQNGDYQNWKTRKALGARIEGGGTWFYTAHFGWWNDADEPFVRQWKNFSRSISDRKANGCVWLLGDFNSPAEVRGEGYDCIRSDGWLDAWLMAEETRGRATVEGKIDGWLDRTENPAEGMRIDHIWCSRRQQVRRARVVFDGKSEPRVSDHCGILIETTSAAE